jgi:thiol-disulfide isomerase/thioredoxin
MFFISIFLVTFLGFESHATWEEDKSAIDQCLIDTDSVPVVDYQKLKPLLHQTNDTTYVVNFWATWCAPCVKELPYFEALRDKYKDDKVKVILVSLDFKKQLETKLYPFLKKKQLKSDVVVLYDSDSNFWINDISESWSGAIPATLVYKNESRSFYEKSFHSQEELSDIIKPYLNL